MLVFASIHCGQDNVFINDSDFPTCHGSDALYPYILRAQQMCLLLESWQLVISIRRPLRVVILTCRFQNYETPQWPLAPLFIQLFINHM